MKMKICNELLGFSQEGVGTPCVHPNYIAADFKHDIQAGLKTVEDGKYKWEGEDD